MDSKEVSLLKKALERQKKARRQAEMILEEKSRKLYETASQLKETNARLENLLSEKTSELEGVFINIVDPYVVMDINGNVIRMNAAAKELLGYDHNEEVFNLTQLVHPDYLEYTQKSFKQLYEVGTLKNYRAKIYVKDKTERFVQVNSSLIYDKDRNPIAAQGIIRDITGEMEAEEQIRASQNRLSTLISNLQTGVLLENEDRKISLTNQIFCDLFQIPVSPDQLKGADCSNAAEDSKHHFTDPEGFVKRIEKILKSKKLVLSDELEMKDGRILERDYIPIFSDGKYKGHLWTYQDVTLRKNYKKNIEAQKEKYWSIIANMNLGLIEVDNDDVIQLVNQSFCKMSGFSEKELLGQKASEILKVHEKNLIEQKGKERLKGKSDSYEVKVVTKSGQTNHWLLSGAPRYDETGKVVGSIGIHLDITAQKNLELQKEVLLTELEASNRGLQEYAHIVSHDLKSPLRSISTLATWLHDDYIEQLDETGVYNLQMMQEKVEGMDKLIDGILKYSSIKSETLEKKPVDLNQVVHDIREIIFIPEHVSVIIMDPLPTLQADATKMHQLFQNLISNAVINIDKSEGIVSIGVAEKKDNWEFYVRDNGIGIPKEYHEKIFKIFQSIGSEERSTGIGLSIVKKIVDLYQGEIWLESKVGEGTTFYFTLKK
ncbi:PAS domain-containing sensor histidine kinase [Muriicola soli]|uniref:histidine kinase n=1 Tax=Muriicola soli TaxID=2507538 RepID=A0A411E7W7_9FLAO|nr:PAS domain-containing sensor histidine kinase [Muriicola soli]QBA63825.1 PAS domain-containing sensor histidine kinase [Muriicola soli]